MHNEQAAQGWHYSMGDGSTHGPVSLDGLRRLIESRKLASHHFVHHATLNEWRAIAEVPELSAAKPIPPPPTVQAPPVATRATFMPDERPAFTRATISRDPRVRSMIATLASLYAVLTVFFLIGALIQLQHGLLSQEFRSGIASAILLPIFVIGAIVVYALPAVVAYLREHRNLIPILIVNVVIGWTLLGWCAALAWAFSSDVPASKRIRA